MMPANAHTSKKFTRMCFEKSEVTLAEKKKIKLVVSKHLTHFCYPIRLVLHQHLNSHVGYVWIQMLMKHEPNGIAEVGEVFAHNHFNFFFCWCNFWFFCKSYIIMDLEVN